MEISFFRDESSSSGLWIIDIYVFKQNEYWFADILCNINKITFQSANICITFIGKMY